MNVDKNMEHPHIALKEAVRKRDPENFSDYGWNFGDYLIDYEFSKQLSQAEVSKILGIPLEDFVRAELGISKYSDEELKQMKGKLK